MVPQDLLYTNEHEWSKVENGVATVGISDHAQESLSDIVFVELPAVGKTVSKGDEVVVVESAKAAASVYAPAAGKVTEVNEALQSDPAIVNQDCYGQGWMYKLELNDEGELGDLMNAEAYEEFLKQQD